MVALVSVVLLEGSLSGSFDFFLGMSLKQKRSFNIFELCTLLDLFNPTSDGMWTEDIV